MYAFLTRAPVLQDGFDPVSESQLKKVLADLRISLPRVYIRFLLRQNGGCFLNYTVGGVINPFPVDILYSIASRYFYCDFSHNVRFNRPILGRRYISIGTSGIGDLLAVRNKSSEDSPVWAVCYMTCEWEVIANSVTEFFESIRYNPTAEDMWYETEPPFTFVERGDVSALPAYKDLLSLKNRSGQSPLYVAVRSSQPRVVEYLLDIGANPNEIDIDGKTRLMGAAMGGRYDICKRLLEYGADANLKNSDGQTALDIAEWAKHERVRDFLRTVTQS